MSHKLYCFVDESGQDTQGRFFVVVAVIAQDSLTALESEASRLESEGGRGIHKWHTSRRRMRRSYAAILPGAEQFKGHIYARIYAEGQNYLDRTAYAVADAIAAYGAQHKLPETKSIITIDGLKDGEARQVRKVIRQRGIFVDKLRGARDQSEVLIRLADSVAGMLRSAYEGDGVFKVEVERLKRRGILTDI